MNKMDMIDFCDRYEIKWFPMKVIKGKIPKYPVEFKAKCDKNDFKTITNEQLKFRQQFRDKCNALALDTGGKIAVIDVDWEDGIDYSNTDGYEWVQDLKKTTAWKKSNTKKQGLHLFVKFEVDGEPILPHKGRIQTKYENIELLTGQWCFAPDCEQTRTIKNPNTLQKLNPYYIVDNEMDLSSEVPIPKSPKPMTTENVNKNENDSGSESPIPKNVYSDLGDLIDIKYLDNYDSWIKIVWSLSNDNKKNYQLAKYLSQKSEKYQEKKFNELWNNTKPRNTIGTFLYYCKISNEYNYHKIRSKEYRDFNDGILAQLFIEEMDNSIVYKETEKQPIFLYNELTGRWTNNIDILKRKITQTLDDNISEMRRHIDDCYRKLYNDILNSIHNKSRKDSIYQSIREKVSHYEDIDFDLNKFILPFKNKVYDLKTFEFRDYQKTDYVTKFIDYELEPKTDDGQEKIEKLFKQIFPDQHFRDDYTLRLATGIYGFITEEFVLANGNGGNGKGVLNELHYAMLTDVFAFNANNKCLLESVKNGLNTNIANMHLKRTIFYREPDDNKKINISTMKELTGGAQMNAERKYSMNDKVIMCATHILECNQKPKLDGRIDNSIARRIRDIPFLSTFVSEDDYFDDKYIFTQDPYFKSDDFKNEMKHQLFHYLIDFIKNYYKVHDKYIWDYTHTSDETKKRSGDYINDSDDLFGFFNERCVKDTECYGIKLKALYEIYKSTDDYLNLSKEEKRIRKQKWFYNYFSTHRILHQCYKARYQPTIDGIQEDHYNVILGYAFRK